MVDFSIPVWCELRSHLEVGRRDVKPNEGTGPDAGPARSPDTTRGPTPDELNKRREEVRKLEEME